MNFHVIITVKFKCLFNFYINVDELFVSKIISPLLVYCMNRFSQCRIGEGKVERAKVEFLEPWEEWSVKFWKYRSSMISLSSPFPLIAHSNQLDVLRLIACNMIFAR